MGTMTHLDGRRLRGERTRTAVLRRATQLASVDGLGGISIGGLAEATDVSKSGIASIFGTKEQLELAVVEDAARVYVETVIEPARAATPRGAARVAALLGRWLDYSAGRVFEGGCFFAAASAEYDSRPGPVRDAIVAARARWTEYVVASIGFAIERGELSPETDAEQLAFELQALGEHANTRSLLDDSREPYVRARRAIRERLSACGASASALRFLEPVAG